MIGLKYFKSFFCIHDYIYMTSYLIEHHGCGHSLASGSKITVDVFKCKKCSKKKEVVV